MESSGICSALGQEKRARALPWLPWHRTHHKPCGPPLAHCPKGPSGIRSFPMSQLFAPGGQIIEASQQTSSEYSGLISFRIDWFNLAIQGTLKSFLQHHNSKASVLWCSAFFMVHLSHPYMTTGKNIALTIWTFVGKVISLLFNTPSRFVIAFLPRRKHLLISPSIIVPTF